MKSNIHALRQRKADIAKRIARIRSKDALSQSIDINEEQQYQSDLVQLATVEAELAAEERVLEAERRMPAMPDENAGFAARAMGYNHPNAGTATATPFTQGKRNYSTLFGQTHDTAGFASLQEYFRAVRMADRQYDPRLAVLAAGSAQNEGTPTDGGFLVPQEYASRLLDQALENAIVWPRAQVWSMTSDTLKIPGVSDQDHSGNVLFGGLAAFWADELGTIDLQSIQTWRLQLSAAKFALLTQSSNELLDDAMPNFETILTSKMSAGCQWHLDNAFLLGSGDQGRPLGAFAAGNPSLIVVAKETSQPAATFTYNNATAMYASLHPNCRGTATWVISSDLLPELLRMVIPVYNVAKTDIVGGVPPQAVSTDANGGYRLLGLPVITTEKLPAAGNQGDVALAAFDQYAVGLRKQVSIEPSRHAGFGTDSTFYRLVTRLAGQPSWKSAIKGKNSKLQSPFVVLAARP